MTQEARSKPANQIQDFDFLAVMAGIIEAVSLPPMIGYIQTEQLQIAF